MLVTISGVNFIHRRRFAELMQMVGLNGTVSLAWWYG